jgi:VIT1/CCC1 family predicted Fe2+/Mn2+ transporter
VLGPCDAWQESPHAIDIQGISIGCREQEYKADFKGVGTGIVRASPKGVARHLTTAIGVLLGVLIFGSLGAFFLYVPILPVAAAVTIMLALILMFFLGVQTGGRRIRVLRRKTAAASQLAELSPINRAE